MSAARVTWSTLLALAALVAPATARAAAPARVPAGRIAVSEPERHRVEFFAPDGTRTAVVPTGIGPRGLARSEDRLVVADRGTERAPGSSLTVIDLARLVATETLFACEACGPGAVDVGGGSTWVTAQAAPAWLEWPAGQSRARRVPIESGVPGRLVAVPGTRWVVAGSRGASLLLLDREARRSGGLDIGPSPELIALRPGTTEVWAALNPEGKLVAVECGGDAPHIVSRYASLAFPQDLAFLPGGRTLAVTGGRDRVLALIDAATGKETGRLRFESGPRNVAVSPDGLFAAVFLPEEGRAAVVDIGDPRVPRAVASFPIDAAVVEWTWLP